MSLWMSKLGVYMPLTIPLPSLTYTPRRRTVHTSEDRAPRCRGWTSDAGGRHWTLCVHMIDDEFSIMRGGGRHLHFLGGTYPASSSLY